MFLTTRLKKSRELLNAINAELTLVEELGGIGREIAEKRDELLDHVERMLALHKELLDDGDGRRSAQPNEVGEGLWNTSDETGGR